MSSKRTGVVVVGLGALGSAAAYHLAQRGVGVIGIDRFAPPHKHGSSNGETRITRLAVGEGEAYLPIVKRSHELWREIERELGCSIFSRTGGIVIDDNEFCSAHGVVGFGQRTAALAKKHGVEHEIMTGRDAASRFPGFNIPPDGFVYYEPDAGFLRPEQAISAQLILARKYGAEILFDEPVTGIAVAGDGSVIIKTQLREIAADSCLVCCGAWVKNFFPEITGPLFSIRRQVLHWLPVKKGAYAISNSPIFIWSFGPAETDMIYGFPSLDGATIKAATESCDEVLRVDDTDSSVSTEEELAFLTDKIADRLSAVAGPSVRSETCRYTVAPNYDFVIDTVPGSPAILIASCCSGHGFKHSAAVGEALAARLHGSAPCVDLSPFEGVLHRLDLQR